MGAPAIASTRGRYAKQNRLTRVQGPGGVDVSYQYDSLGRMLTRVSGGVTTRFTWDGWNCVKEDDGTNTFRWYCPEGELFSFERNSTFYQVHLCALGSVRAITDSTGAVVGSWTYGAWGELLSASEPSGFVMPYKWIGGWGVRHDPATGLYYMRNRWYDAGLGRFLTHDPAKNWDILMSEGEENIRLKVVRIRNRNHLASTPRTIEDRHPSTYLMNPKFQNYVLYAQNNPVFWTDSTGLAPTLTWTFPPYFGPPQKFMYDINYGNDRQYFCDLFLKNCQGECHWYQAIDTLACGGYLSDAQYFECMTNCTLMRINCTKKLPTVPYTLVK